MSNIPSELRYAASHEWIRPEGDGIYTIGISDHAQGLLGDVVYVELPEVGSTVTAYEEAGVVESVKAASDIFSPISGEVVEINEDLEDTPELVNSDVYGDGWLYRVEASDTTEIDELLDAESYAESLEDED